MRSNRRIKANDWQGPSLSLWMIRSLKKTPTHGMPRNNNDKGLSYLTRSVISWSSHLWWGRVWKWLQNVSWSQYGGAGPWSSSVCSGCGWSNRRRQCLRSPRQEQWSGSRETPAWGKSLSSHLSQASSECSKCARGSSGRHPCWVGGGPSHSGRTGPPGRLRWRSLEESPGVRRSHSSDDRVAEINTPPESKWNTCWTRHQRSGAWKRWIWRRCWRPWRWSRTWRRGRCREPDIPGPHKHQTPASNLQTTGGQRRWEWWGWSWESCWRGSPLLSCLSRWTTLPG